MPTVRGKYSSDSLGKDATGPLKPREMETSRTKSFTVKDGESFADLVDKNSREDSNYGHTASIKRKR
jgi:hypothetical protein